MTPSFIHKPLLIWYNKYKRDLPWRRMPDAYSVWLSEIILQQTRIEQGTSYYHNILNKAPDVRTLAGLEEEEMLFLWKGLGYYSRARNLLHTAKVICNEHNGTFPTSYPELLKLKGIGPYTAAAIASIAFGEQKAAVDGNVIRVVSRLYALREKISSAMIRKVQLLADEMIPAEHPGDFNQAMMDLGSTICKPHNPLCTDCPISQHCQAYAQGIEKELPLPKDKTKTRKRYFHYLLLIDDQNHCLIEKRIQKDIWQGLYQFPLLETSRTKALGSPELSSFIDGFGEIKGQPIQGKQVKHILSHQLIHAKLIVAKVSKLPESEDRTRCKVSELDNYAMPRLIEKLIVDGTIQTAIHQ